jgi:hypothetical protein
MKTLNKLILWLDNLGLGIKKLKKSGDWEDKSMLLMKGLL